MRIVELEQFRTFEPDRMRKNNLFETANFFLDLYCLEAGQSQAAHTHAREDKVYLVLEGEGTFRVGEEEAALEAGQAVLAEAGAIHGVVNEGPERLVVLVLMAPHPNPPA
jgi:quercetin dioxygenase-like cupin family protein